MLMEMGTWLYDGKWGHGYTDGKVGYGYIYGKGGHGYTEGKRDMAILRE